MTALGRKTPASELPRAAMFVRWIIAGLGVVTLSVLLAVDPPALASLRYLVLYVAAIAAADTLFLVRIGPGAYFSIAPTFILVYFAMAGSTAAAAAGAASQLILWMVRRLRFATSETPHYALFNAGQQILAVIFGGVIVQFSQDVNALSGPITRAPVAVIVTFAASYLLFQLALMSLAVYSLSGWSDVRHTFLPTAGLWTAISVAVCTPFAIVNRLLGPEFGGYIRATIFTFLVLAGIALVVRLNVRLRYGNSELHTINAIGRLLTSTLDLREIFGLIARESRNVLSWDRFFIAVGEGEAESIELIFVSEEGEETGRRLIPARAGLVGRVISTGHSLRYDQASDPKVSLAHDEAFRGSRRPRSVAIAPLKFGDNVIGAIAVQSFQPDAYRGQQLRLLETISAQAAIAVRNARLFESETRAKNERDEFLSLVTHEIKNPLTSIRGYASIVRDGAAEGDFSPIPEAIRVIESESAKILRLTEDLLDASRMSAGRFSVRFESVDLAVVARQVVTKYEATSDRRFQCRLPDNSPPVQGDEIRLSQVVENLVSNAVKYSPVGTAVEVSLRWDDSRVFLAVKDEGHGIPPERVPLLFERYYRVEERSMVKGTGLGLFISREIVRMHGGNISVESTPGKGSEFTVELPLQA